MQTKDLNIRKKLTLTVKEQEAVVLGTLQIKRSETYKKAILFFEETNKKIGGENLDQGLSRFWIDEKDFSIKMVFSPKIPEENEALKKIQKLQKIFKAFEEALK